MNLEEELAERFRPGASVDASIAIVAGALRVTFTAPEGTLRFETWREPDVTFTFDCTETALAVLTGTENPFDAFLDGRFRSDGHLPLAFALLGLFNPGFDPAPPP